MLTISDKRRLIDKDALKAGYIAWFYGGRYIPERDVETAPEIDAVEVVRCKDCKHMIAQSYMRYCTVWRAVNCAGDEGFCNYGERRGADE